MVDTALPLRQRARRPTPAELDAIPWLKLLDGPLRERALATLEVGDAQPGERLCRIGRPATFWFGVVDGLLKMNNDDSLGQAVTFTGVPPGGWFGEGTLLKRECYRYNIQALRPSIVAGLPIDSFHVLLDGSIAFNRFVLDQLNERLGQFIAARETDRIHDPDVRVARNLAALFHPTLYPGVGSWLRIAAGAGLSRGPVAATCEPGAAPAVGCEAHPHRVRRAARAGPAGAAALRDLRHTPPGSSGGSARGGAGRIRRP